MVGAGETLNCQEIMGFLGGGVLGPIYSIEAAISGRHTSDHKQVPKYTLYVPFYSSSRSSPRGDKSVKGYAKMLFRVGRNLGRGVGKGMFEVGNLFHVLSAIEGR